MALFQRPKFGKNAIPPAFDVTTKKLRSSVKAPIINYPARECDASPVGIDHWFSSMPRQSPSLQAPPPSLRKSFEPTRLLRQVRHRFHLDSAFVLIQP